jgi:fatty acid desaturase
MNRIHSLPGKRLPLLRQRADVRTLGLLLAQTAGFGALLAGGSWAWLAPCLILTITACAAKHNHTHRPVFSRRWANRALDLWLTLLTGSSTTGIRMAHQVRHHGRNQSEDDFVRCSMVAGLPPAAALLRFVPAVVARVWRDGRSDLDGPCRRPLRRAVAFERLALWCFVAGGAALGGWRFLLAMGACWGAAQWFLIAVNLPQHDGCDPKDPWEHSRNMVGRFSNWVLLNNGYHTAHHEWPASHWSELPELHARHVAPHLGPGYDATSVAGFWVGWWRRRSLHATRVP